MTGINVLHATNNTRKRAILLSTWWSQTTQFMSRDVGCARSTANLLNPLGNMLSVRYYSIYDLEYCIFVLINLLCCLSQIFFLICSLYIGPLPKANCSKIFSAQGCNLCLRVFDSSSSLSEHKRSCCGSPPTPIVCVKWWFLFIYVYLNFTYFLHLMKFLLPIKKSSVIGENFKHPIQNWSYQSQKLSRNCI